MPRAPEDDWLDAQLISANPPETQALAELPLAGRLLAQRQASFALVCDDEPLTPATFAREVTMVARLAVADADYSAAEKLYKLVGMHIRALEPSSDTHQHVHLHSSLNSTADYARQSDASLRALVAEAEHARANQSAPVPSPDPTGD